MNWRLQTIFFLLVGFFFLIVSRLFFWQILVSETFSELSEKQTLASFSIPAKRGKIFANDGTPLVINQRAFLLYSEPKKIKEKKEVTKILSQKLGIDIASLSAKLNSEKINWVAIADNIQEEDKEAITKYKFEGIDFLEKSIRFYPEASMAAHLLGFVGKNSRGEDQGYFGIEGYYDEQLRGRDGILKQEKDALGNPILSGKILEIPAENGRDLVLTIDKTIQFIVENKLKEAIERYGAKGGTVIVMEPFSGAILAMASFPSYVPSKFYLYPSENYKNPAISFSYEPGSTFKVLVAAAALNEKKIDLETKFEENGPIKVGGYSIKTWNEKYHGKITLREILEYSSNVGMVLVQKKMGEETLLRYLDDLGFGKKTGIDLEEESSPHLRPKNKWYEIDFATVSFGQGIAVTPIQMIKAVATLANGGNLMRPFLVKEIRLPNGERVITQPKVERKVFKKETTEIISEIMVSAVENGETRFIRPLGYKIAGKTGTAQIPIKGHYDEGKTITSFVGFAPFPGPKFVMLVILQEPTASVWGAETAAPTFFAIAQELFPYLKISPSE